jgi:hypothetical protein
MRVHISRTAVVAFAAMTLAAAAASPGPAQAFPFFQPQPVTAGKPGKMSTAPNRSSFAPANKGAAAKAQANVNTGQGVRVQRVWIVRPGVVVSKGGSSAGSSAQGASSSGGGAGSSSSSGGGSSSFGDILKEKLGEVFKAKVDELLKLPSK